MLPRDPLDPWPWNFPFHDVVGIQTSKPIIEVLVGCARPTTRQKGGKLMIGGAGGGGSNSPEVTDAAKTILASGSTWLVGFSHEAAPDRVAPPDGRTVNAMARARSAGLKRETARPASTNLDLLTVSPLGRELSD